MSEDLTTIRLDPVDDILLNPGMGFETFHCFNGDARHEKALNYPDCSIAYFRFYWDVLEPTEGVYNFDLIEGLLQTARERKQDLALRFMPMASPGTDLRTPSWFMEKAAGTTVTRKNNTGTSWVPDHNDATFLDKQHDLVAAFGERYNGHPDLIRMDIGSVGFWGEWHISNTDPPVPMISDENGLRVIDWYLKSWGKTPLSMLIGHAVGLRYASERGCGWRADSLGDYGHFNPPWCHMYHRYPKQLADADAYDAWRKGPVTFEPPGMNVDMDDYVPSRAGGYDAMWDQALAWHATSHNPKSVDIPDSQVEANTRFLKRCGYRLVLEKAAFSSNASGKLTFRASFVNEGCAPPYTSYVLALRLRGGSGEHIVDLDADVKEWLPGAHVIDTSVTLPGGTSSGSHELALGVLDPHYREPEITLANTGRADDGWYPLGIVNVD